MDETPGRSSRLRSVLLALTAGFSVCLGGAIAVLAFGPAVGVDGGCPLEGWRMRSLAWLCLEAGQPLASDGRLDVYAVLLKESLPADRLVEACTDPRTGIGPTLEEIRRGDYTRFPYRRRKGRLAPDAPAAPVLWEPRGARRGGRLIAFSDGSLVFRHDAEADEILRNDPGQE